MRKYVSPLILLLIFFFMLVFFPEMGIARTYDYIFIKEDGSIDPITAPIQRSGNIYILKENTAISLIIEKDDFVLDGAGYTLEGPGFGDSPPRINMTGISNLTITNMVLRGPNHGIVMSNCSSIKIIDNDIEIRLGKKGVLVKSSSNISIMDNRIIGKMAAVELSMSSNSTINGNYLSTYTGFNGILLYNSSNNEINSNFFYSSTYGVNLYYSDGNRIFNNNLTSHWTSIALESSSNNQIVENILEDNKRMTYDIGFQMNNSSNNDFIGNIIRNSQRCIQIDYSSNNKLENNIITGSSITDTDSWGIKLTESNNIIIIGNHLNLATLNEDYPGIVFGILLEYSSNNLIIDNNVTYYEGGLGIKSSHNNTISENIITNNFRGLDLTASDYNIVSGNQITNNNDGIALENMYNNIIENIITDNSNFGIYLYGAGYNNIIGNNITNNGRGISISICYNTTIFHNNFVNNRNHVETDDSNGIWDKNEEGNYWDNYNGADNDGDGIGDIPHLINENNQDNYPLVEPTIIPEFPSWPILQLIVVVTLVSVTIRNKLRRNWLE